MRLGEEVSKRVSGHAGMQARRKMLRGQVGGGRVDEWVRGQARARRRRVQAAVQWRIDGRMYGRRRASACVRSRVCRRRVHRRAGGRAGDGRRGERAKGRAGGEASGQVSGRASGCVGGRASRCAGGRVSWMATAAAMAAAAGGGIGRGHSAHTTQGLMWARPVVVFVLWCVRRGPEMRGGA